MRGVAPCILCGPWRAGGTLCTGHPAPRGKTPPVRVRSRCCNPVRIFYRRPCGIPCPGIAGATPCQSILLLPKRRPFFAVSPPFFRPYPGQDTPGDVWRGVGGRPQRSGPVVQIKPDHLPVVDPQKKPQRGVDCWAHRYCQIFAVCPACRLKAQHLASQRRHNPVRSASKLNTTIGRRRKKPGRCRCVTRQCWQAAPCADRPCVCAGAPDWSPYALFVPCWLPGLLTGPGRDRADCPAKAACYFTSTTRTSPRTSLAFLRKVWRRSSPST